MRRWTTVVTKSVTAVAITVILVAGCSHSPGPASIAAEGVFPTNDTPKAVDPEVHAQITFDPCADIPEEAFRAERVDLSTGQKSEHTSGGYTSILCTFDSIPPDSNDTGWFDLYLLASNRTLDEAYKRDPENTTETTVSGRPALVKFDPNVTNSCEISMSTRFGLISIKHHNLTREMQPMTDDARCSRTRSFVERIEDSVDREVDAGRIMMEVATTVRTPRVVDDSERPDITFDPCLDVPMEILLERGFDDRSKDLTDLPFGTYTFISCSWKSFAQTTDHKDSYAITFLAGNVSYEEYLKRDRDISTEITINSRRALLQHDRNDCAIILDTKFGVLVSSWLHFPYDNEPIPSEKQCAPLFSLVQDIETLVDL